MGGAGDNGADVKGTAPAGRRWVIQCKHRRDEAAGAAVGTPDLHVLNGTGCPVHGGDVVVLVTNGRFSAPAVKFARSQRLHLVDRGLLNEWAAGPSPLWALLPHLPAPRSSSRSRGTRRLRSSPPVSAVPGSTSTAALRELNRPRGRGGPEASSPT
ncbi:restriction endonuclease [Streptomyces sp. NPDC056254]|uniref:restriction endonuclease n=1 Tax=Streptomyces sp. NPDC056254 TaxID=3345763 RepID=UPI0035DC0AE8